MSDQAFNAVLDAMTGNAMKLELFRDDVTVYGQQRSNGWHARLSIDEGEAVLYLFGAGRTPHEAIAGLAKELEGRK